MKLRVTILLIFVLSYANPLLAQTIPKEELIFLTSEWKGERFPDGRPKIAENLLQRAKIIGIDDAWTVLKNLGYLNQFEGGWKTVNDLPVTGRAYTAVYMPGRPDVMKNIKDRGAKQGRTGDTHTWPIEMLTKGDVYVAHSYGKPLIGSTLGNSIYSKSGNGVVFDGSARDVHGLSEITGFNAFVRYFHPSFVEDLVLMGLNTPARIGNVMVLPGDLVIGGRIGVLFVPAHLAEQVVATAEFVMVKDKFGFEMVKSARYTTGQIDSQWTDVIKDDFIKWLAQHPEEPRITRAQLDELMKNRTW